MRGRGTLAGIGGRGVEGGWGARTASRWRRHLRRGGRASCARTGDPPSRSPALSCSHPEALLTPEQQAPGTPMAGAFGIMLLTCGDSVKSQVRVEGVGGLA